METMAKISNQQEWAFNHPEKLEPTDLWYDDGADHLIIEFFRGGGMFEVTAPGLLSQKLSGFLLLASQLFSICSLFGL